MNNELNVYVDCKEDKKEGFIHIDSRNIKNIDHICSAWEVSKYIYNADLIYCENLEYLTNFEADRALRDWLRALRTDGFIELKLSNMDYYCKLWLDSTWNEDTIKDINSKAKKSFNGIYGEQIDCDPWGSSYDIYKSSVKKSAYNKSRITLLLTRIGYGKIHIEDIDEEFFKVKAKKIVNNSERQTEVELEKIRIDHRKRYEFASKVIEKKDCLVSDAACGVGYGSYILSLNENIKNINAVDISEEAIEHAKKYFYSSKVNYHISNLDLDEIAIESPDYFISFETIEHLNYPIEFIKKIYENLKEGGVFIGSTPNEDIMPFSVYHFQYHTRHFTNKELLEILENIGFQEITLYGQSNKAPSDLEKDALFEFTIFTAKK